MATDARIVRRPRGESREVAEALPLLPREPEERIGAELTVAASTDRD
jgi:hypothetical protein